jgi:fucokinase
MKENGRLFDPDSAFSADDLVSVIRNAGPETQVDWLLNCLREALEICKSTETGGGDCFASKRKLATTASPGVEKLRLSRILHTLGSAVIKFSEEPGGRASIKKLLASVYGRLTKSEKAWLASLNIPSAASASPQAWALAAQDAAFENISRTIVSCGISQSGQPKITLNSDQTTRPRNAPHTARPAQSQYDLCSDRPSRPRNALRSDEIIWGRAPARLDLGGGWTDTPPYSLENGGCVINAAVNLNGQPPIQVYARIIPEPVVRIYSIDHGAQLTIRTMAELLDYRLPTSKFGLAKATLALCGFGPDADERPGQAGARDGRGRREGQGGSGRGPARGDAGCGESLKARLTAFGGGIELSTLAAIPSGSGLGTSSIMGAALMAVVHRMIGREVSPRDLFHLVLQLEQELTTGGGWQDQVGGVLPGVKMIRTEPGMVPDPQIHYVTADVLDPGGNLWNGGRFAGGERGGMGGGTGRAANGGQTLLYYTGLRRLAKNILRTVVGNYLDRDREAMATLRELHAYPPKMSEAMAAKDMRRFGELIDLAWRLNKRIDPDSTTPVIEAILGKIKKHIWGAKLLGAGGGGFLLIVAKSPGDAARVRRILEGAPPNDRARFFDYDISHEGLNVTVC